MEFSLKGIVLFEWVWMKSAKKTEKYIVFTQTNRQPRGDKIWFINVDITFTLWTKATLVMWVLNKQLLSRRQNKHIFTHRASSRKRVMRDFFPAVSRLSHFRSSRSYSEPSRWYHNIMATTLSFKPMLLQLLTIMSSFSQHLKYFSRTIILVFHTLSSWRVSNFL